MPAPSTLRSWLERFHDQGASVSGLPATLPARADGWEALTSNLLTLLAATALDAEYRHARPIFNHVGTVVSRAGRIVMQEISRVLDEVIGPGLRRLRRPAWQVA